MNRLCGLLLLVLVHLPLQSAQAEAAIVEKPLEIGVVPYISARVLVGSYEPLRQYLERALGRQVKLYSANSFKLFYENARRGDYDLVITAAHFARLLQKDDQFTPLARFTAGGRGLILTTSTSTLNSIQKLRGQHIAIPDPLSLASIVCLTYLRENGLKADTDFKILEVPSFMSAILSVQQGEAQAAVTAAGALAQMPRELQESMKTLADAGEFPSLIFLAHPRLAAAKRELLKNELLKFSANSNEGKQFFGSTGFESLVPVTSSDMARLDRYSSETRRLLEATP